VRIALTCNGPGEFSGWLRPLLSALYRAEPALDATVFFVPDDYATGREPDVARRLFPQARIVDAKAYVGFALGRARAGIDGDVDLVQYLGGDLLHAVRVRGRLGGRLRSYKFARGGAKSPFERVYAVDAKNANDLRKGRVEAERIDVVGNLAIDGALAEARGEYAAAGNDRVTLAPGGVVVMPGTRKHEVANLVPFFLKAAVRLRVLAPELPLAFAISPFTTVDELASALASGGHPRVWGARGALEENAGELTIVAESGERFAVVRDAMRHVASAKFVVTIPGTKCIELAALGVPAIVCVPLNAPESVVINGVLQYIDRIPFLGIALKRAAVIAVDARFTMTAQPNMDAGEFLMPELRGTLTPATVARAIAAYANDDDARERASHRLRELYVAHVGASERMAASLLGARA
jgi:hypothetical protein